MEFKALRGAAREHIDGSINDIIEGLKTHSELEVFNALVLANYGSSLAPNGPIFSAIVQAETMLRLARLAKPVSVPQTTLAE